MPIRELFRVLCAVMTCAHRYLTKPLYTLTLTLTLTERINNRSGFNPYQQGEVEQNLPTGSTSRSSKHEHLPMV